MSLFLLAVFAPVIVSPLLFILSAKGRKIVMSIYIIGLLYLAFSLLSNPGLGSYTFFSTSLFQLESKLTLLSFSEHPYSIIAAFGFLFVGAIGLLYGLDVSKAGEQAIALGAIASAVGVAFADNFLTFLFFWELLTLTTSTLIFLRQTPFAVRMAYRALFFSLVSGFLLTVGILLQFNATGTFELMYPVAGLPFFILGIGIKTAFLLLHFWVPWGYPAASFPCSVLLAALCTKVGVYAVARILPPTPFINTMGACMAIVAVTLALLQSDLRRLLSYHIISQVGYMVAGVGLGATLGVDGGLLHLVNHMIYKALLFMSAGALIFAVGTEDLHELHDPAEKPEATGKVAVWKTLPVAFIGAVVGALAISGTPLFNGYVSKYLLKTAMHGTNPAEWMLMVASVGTALSFSKFVYFGFIKGRGKILRKLTGTMQAAILILSASCIVTGIWPRLLAPILPGASSLQVYSAEGVKIAGGLVVLGILIFILLAGTLEKETKFAFPLQFSMKIKELDTGFSRGFSNAVDNLYYSSIHLLRSFDYKPLKTQVQRFFNFNNFNFGVMMLMLMLGIAVVFLLYLQWGIFGAGV